MRKRSAAKQRNPHVFFIDRSLGKIDVPEALRDAGYRCELHDEHWPPTTEDEVWLKGVAAKGWVVLTKDERIRYRPLELRTLFAAGVRAFILICGNVRGEETAAILLRAMPRINAVLAARKRGPFLYCVYKNSRIAKIV